MNLPQLEYFKKVAEVGNLTKAAEDLCVTPSSVSKGISNLEKEWGVSLFTRENKSMILNDHGKKVLEYVTEVFYTISQLEEYIHRERDSHETISMLVTSKTDQLMANVIWGDPLANNRYRIRFCDSLVSKEQIDQDILNTTLHMALSPYPTNHYALDSTLFFQECACLNVPKGHRLYEKEEISLFDLEGERVVVLSSEFPFRSVLLKCFHDQGIRIQPEFMNIMVYFTHSYSNNLPLLTTDLFNSHFSVYPDVKIIRFKEKIKYSTIFPLYLTYKKTDKSIAEELLSLRKLVFTL